MPSTVYANTPHTRLTLLHTLSTLLVHLPSAAFLLLQVLLRSVRMVFGIMDARQSLQLLLLLLLAV